MDKITCVSPAGFAPKSRGGVRYFERGTRVTIYGVADSDDVSFNIQYSDGTDTWISAHAYSSYTGTMYGDLMMLYLFRITVTVKGPMTIHLAW